MTLGWEITVGAIVGTVLVMVAAWLWDRWTP